MLLSSLALRCSRNLGLLHDRRPFFSIICLLAPSFHFQLSSIIIYISHTFQSGPSQFPSASWLTLILLSWIILEHPKQKNRTHCPYNIYLTVMHLASIVRYLNMNCLFIEVILLASRSTSKMATFDVVLTKPSVYIGWSYQKLTPYHQLA
jgi:hypothetical protein